MSSINHTLAPFPSDRIANGARRLDHSTGMSRETRICDKSSVRPFHRPRSREGMQLCALGMRLSMFPVLWTAQTGQAADERGETRRDRRLGDPTERRIRRRDAGGDDRGWEDRPALRADRVRRGRCPTKRVTTTPWHVHHRVHYRLKNTAKMGQMDRTGPRS